MNIQNSVSRNCANKREVGYFDPKIRLKTLLSSRAVQRKNLVQTTVLEVCSEGSTPIAADILTRAGAPGNSFAFLMGGVSTDYTEIMVLRDTTQSWKVALFLPLITLPQVIVLGWVINVFTV